MAKSDLAQQLREAVRRREAALRFDWAAMARPNQRLPTGDWRTWLILAGRGWGKTLTGAQTIRIWAKNYAHIALIGATTEDARDIMVEGPTGILAICPDHERPAYYPAKHLLVWPKTGSRTLIFTADEPERLRGKQFMKLWADEVASWRYVNEAWTQAMLGLRMGKSPQAVVTTTPKPIKLIRDLAIHRTTVLTRGSTYENRANLAEQFFSEIITKFEGTRLGRQELMAEILSDNPGALWTSTEIDVARVSKLSGELQRVVVAIDPSGTSGEASDECGIVVAGKDSQRPPHFYVMADLSLKGSPDAWARKGIAAYRGYGADRVVAEGNYGGDMVESVLRNIDQNVAFKKVTASRGKMIRAEPVAALYEQHRVHHVGVFSELEQEMVEYVPGSSDSPDRMDALVWAIHELSDGGSDGFLRYLEAHHEMIEAEDAAMQARRGGIVSGGGAGQVTANVVTDHFGNAAAPAESGQRFRFSDPYGVLRR